MPINLKPDIAGFGSGKTWVGCGGICKGIWEHRYKLRDILRQRIPEIRDIFYPTVEEVAADWGLNVKINEGNKEVHFYYGRQYRGTTICRSMEKPQTIVGFKIGNALVDELDILPKEKARTAWRKIIARMRYKIDGLRNGITLQPRRKDSNLSTSSLLKPCVKKQSWPHCMVWCRHLLSIIKRTCQQITFLHF
ncbi:terminase large subunit domain-containing protein [Escherichia coli]